MQQETKIEKIQYKEKNFQWICINHVNEKSIGLLKRNYKFHPLDLEDCLSETQRSKIDEYDDYLFIVLHVPDKVGRRKQIRNSEIDIFIGPNYVITLHEDNQTLQSIFKACKNKKSEREEYMGKGSGYFLYMIIDELFASCFPIVDDLGKQINELEKEVFEADHSKDRLKDILVVKKDTINFRRIIMPQRAIIAQLEHKNKKFLPENLDVYFDDVVDKIEKIWNNLENLQELIVSLQETNESILSHNTNNIIKILTVFSVIMLPLSVITGFYGMNVEGLPFASASNPILFITGILLAVAVSMVAYFRYRKWI